MPRDGRFIEAIGFYDPKTEPSTVEIDAVKARAWLDQGAQPSNTVSKLLAIAGVTKAAEPAKAKKPTKPAKKTAAEATEAV